MTEQEQLFKNTFLSIYQLIPFKMRVEKWIADEYLKNLTYICHECGCVMDRDENAAINLLNYGKIIYLKNSQIK